MRPKTIAVFQAALLGFLLTQGRISLGQETQRTKPGDLAVKQHIIEQYLDSGEFEYKTAIDRKATDKPLWRKDIVNAKVRLVAIFTLMDGNGNGVPPSRNPDW